MVDVRPIDANALYNQITKEIKKYLIVEPDTKRIIEYGYHADDILASISQAPKLDYEPTRHGEWVECKEIFNDEQELVDAISCSQCGKSQRVFRRTPYCPNCGAKMDGGERR